MSRNKELPGLLASAMAMSAMCGEPYSAMGFRVPRGKRRPGTLVCCHVCGAGGGRITLYNDGGSKICAKCRAAQKEAEAAIAKMKEEM